MQNVAEGLETSAVLTLSERQLTLAYAQSATAVTEPHEPSDDGEFGQDGTIFKNVRRASDHAP